MKVEGGPRWNRVQEWSRRRELLSLSENTPSKRDKSLWPQFLQNMKLFLECVFMPFPDVADRSEFSLNSSLRLARIRLYASMKNHVFAIRGLVLVILYSLNSKELCSCDLY